MSHHSLLINDQFIINGYDVLIISNNDNTYELVQVGDIINDNYIVIEKDKMIDILFGFRNYGLKVKEINDGK